MSAPRFQGMRSEAINANTVSMSTDVIAVIDHSDPKLVRVFDTASGKELGKPIQHVLDITSVQLNRWGSATQRKCILQVLLLRVWNQLSNVQYAAAARAAACLRGPSRLAARFSLLCASGVKGPGFGVAKLSRSLALLLALDMVRRFRFFQRQ